MLDILTQAGNAPFSVALAVVLLLAALQFVGLADVIGADFDLDVDADLDAGADVSIDAGLMSLLGLGRVPFVMWLMILLSLFAAIGFAGQQLLTTLTGAGWSAWLMGPTAGLVALPATGLICRPLGRILPRDETSAIHVEGLVGREAQVVIGTATMGSPARGRVIDQFGQTHHVMLEPEAADQRFVAGERVLLVRMDAQVFRAVARGDHYLPRLD